IDEWERCEAVEETVEEEPELTVRKAEPDRSEPWQTEPVAEPSSKAGIEPAGDEAGLEPERAGAAADGPEMASHPGGGGVLADRGVRHGEQDRQRDANRGCSTACAKHGIHPPPPGSGRRTTRRGAALTRGSAAVPARADPPFQVRCQTTGTKSSSSLGERLRATTSVTSSTMTRK